MTKFVIDVAADVRAHGTIEVIADTAQQAVDMVDLSYVNDNFVPDIEAFDMTPLDAYLSDIENSETLECQPVSKQLFNDHFRLSRLFEPDALLVLNALRLYYLAEPNTDLMVIINELESQFKHIKGVIP